MILVYRGRNLKEKKPTQDMLYIRIYSKMNHMGSFNIKLHIIIVVVILKLGRADTISDPVKIVPTEHKKLITNLHHNSSLR